MSLDSVMQLGKIEIEEKICDSLVVKLRTLTSIEYSKIMKSSASPSLNENQGLSTFGYLTDLQIETLSYATMSINGQIGSQEDFKKVYQNMQTPLLAEVYSVYSKILENQNKVLEELKKNSVTSPLSVVTT